MNSPGSGRTNRVAKVALATGPWCSSTVWGSQEGRKGPSAENVKGSYCGTLIKGTTTGVKDPGLRGKGPRLKGKGNVEKMIRTPVVALKMSSFY